MIPVVISSGTMGRTGRDSMVPAGFWAENMAGRKFPCEAGSGTGPALVAAGAVRRESVRTGSAGRGRAAGNTLFSGNSCGAPACSAGEKRTGLAGSGRAAGPRKCRSTSAGAIGAKLLKVCWAAAKVTAASSSGRAGGMARTALRCLPRPARPLSLTRSNGPGRAQRWHKQYYIFQFIKLGQNNCLT